MAQVAHKILIIACGALAREVLAIVELNGWQHIALQCLPADLHLTPDKIPDAVAALVNKNCADYQQIFVAYADCGTGGVLQQRCDELGVKMIAGPHCYSFFEGNETFAKHPDEITTFYLTDFLARQFDAFVWRPMGLDKHPQLLEVMFGNYEKLVYMAQTDDAELDTMARDAARRLGLEYERRQTGYGDLASTLESFVS